MDCKWEIVLAGAIVPVFYGTTDNPPSADAVREMLIRRKGNLGDGVFVRPEAVLAVVRSGVPDGANRIMGD